MFVNVALMYIASKCHVVLAPIATSVSGGKPQSWQCNSDVFERKTNFQIEYNFDNSTTKELQVDLRKSGTPTSPISIKGVDVDIVQVYSNPGVHRTVSFTEQRTPT